MYVFRKRPTGEFLNSTTILNWLSSLYHSPYQRFSLSKKQKESQLYVHFIEVKQY